MGRLWDLTYYTLTAVLPLPLFILASTELHAIHDQDLRALASCIYFLAMAISIAILVHGLAMLSKRKVK